MDEVYDMHWEFQDKGNIHRAQHIQQFSTREEAWQECFNMANNMSQCAYDYWKTWVKHPNGKIGMTITPG